jgi:hypothetical protein
MYHVHDCIWWYILVYISSYWYILVYGSCAEYIVVLVGIENSKIMHEGRNRTRDLSHCNQHARLLCYKRYFDCHNLESRRYMSPCFAENTLFHLVAGVVRPPAPAMTSPAWASTCTSRKPFGSTDVKTDSRPSEKQAAAGQLAGGGAVNTHEAGHCAAS